MTSWAIVQGGTTVNLPQPPDDHDDDTTAQIEFSGVDGGQEVATSRYVKARPLVLTGSIFDSSKNTVGQLESTYLAPLRAMVRQQVTITDPDSQYGGNWILSRVHFHRVKTDVNPIVFTFTFEFYQASTEIIL